MGSNGGPDLTTYNVSSPLVGSPSRHITVMDVYELAAAIGTDFEKLIELHGQDAVQNIMPKVIAALETLESLAAKNDRENEEIATLKSTVDRLEVDRRQRILERKQIDDALAEAEDSYRNEIEELRAAVNTLNAQNRRLTDTVQSMPTHSDDDCPLERRMQEEVRALVELRETAHAQKSEIRVLRQELSKSGDESDALHNSIERLIRQNEELLRKNRSLQTHGRQLVEERSSLLRRLESSETRCVQLASRLRREEPKAESSDSDEDRPRFTLAELREVLREKNELKAKLIEMEEAAENQRQRAPSPPPAEPSSVKQENREAEEEVLVYGPINREPDEKLHPWKYERKDSGVRRFFRFFKDAATPRRGSAPGSPKKRASIPVPTVETTPAATVN